MFCSKCGAANLEGVKVCESCGAVLVRRNAMPSWWAIAGIVLGVLGIFTGGLLIFPAIICGIVAVVKISGNHGELRGKGMAVVGIIILPLMILVLLGVLLPALTRPRSVAYRMLCGTNLNAISKSLESYQSDYDGKFPPGDKWCDLLVENYSVTGPLLRCHGGSEGPCNYSMNAAVIGRGADLPVDMVLLFDSKPGWNMVGGREDIWLENHRGEGINVLLVDGLVEFVGVEDLDGLVWEVGE